MKANFVVLIDRSNGVFRVIDAEEAELFGIFWPDKRECGTTKEVTDWKNYLLKQGFREVNHD